MARSPYIGQFTLAALVIGYMSTKLSVGGIQKLLTWAATLEQ